MSYVQAYFTTKLKQYGAQQQVMGGVWSITHLSVTDPLHGLGKSFRSMYGMKWTDFRRHLAAVLSDTSRDPYLIQRIKQMIHPKIPLRTGKLMDWIFRTMKIDRKVWYNTHHWAMFEWELPPDRPNIIKGKVKHRPPEKGYGDWGTYKPTDPIVTGRVSVEEVLPSGNAIYNLDDPSADNDYESVLRAEAEKELIEDFASIFNDMLIICQI